MVKGILVYMASVVVNKYWYLKPESKFVTWLYLGSLLVGLGANFININIILYVEYIHLWYSVRVCVCFVRSASVYISMCAKIKL